MADKKNKLCFGKSNDSKIILLIYVFVRIDKLYDICFSDNRDQKSKTKTKSKSEDKQPLLTPPKKQDKIFDSKVPLQSSEMVFIFQRLKC